MSASGSIFDIGHIVQSVAVRWENHVVSRVAATPRKAQSRDQVTRGLARPVPTRRSWATSGLAREARGEVVTCQLVDVAGISALIFAVVELPRQIPISRNDAPGRPVTARSAKFLLSDDRTPGYGNETGFAARSGLDQCLLHVIGIYASAWPRSACARRLSGSRDRDPSRAAFSGPVLGRRDQLVSRAGFPALPSRCR